MANAFDMFKKAAMAVPDYSDGTELTVGSSFTCPSDGFLLCHAQRSGTGEGEIKISINGTLFTTVASNNYSHGYLFLSVAKGDAVLVTQSNLSKKEAVFYPVREA